MSIEPGDGSRKRVRRWIVALSVAAVPVMQGSASAATPTFACDADMWQPLTMDVNHDNLFSRFSEQTAAPGQAVTFSLVWEWRDWVPGTELGIRHCLDVDAVADGVATAPYDDLGANPPDTTVVHPTEQPTPTVMKETEVRPAVVMPFTVTVPASAPAGSEVCMRSAILPNNSHLHSPPGYDISETACLTVVAPRNVAAPTPAPPAPAPALPPEGSTENLNQPPPVVAPQPAAPPQSVPSEVLGVRILPRTGVPLPVLVAAGALLLLGGALAVRLMPRPFLVFEELRPGRRKRH